MQNQHFNLHVLEVMRRFEGIAETPGPSDNPIIVMAHKLCGITGKSEIDEIPHCASDLNLCIVLANIERNPALALKRLQKKGFKDDFIESLFKLVNKSITENLEETGLVWVEPTWSPAARSFESWGNQKVTMSQLKVGDIVVFTRDGGGHVAIYLGQNTFSLIVFGGNQKNKFCVSEGYVKTRFVTGRRFNETV